MRLLYCSTGSCLQQDSGFLLQPKVSGKTAVGRHVLVASFSGVLDFFKGSPYKGERPHLLLILTEALGWQELQSRLKTHQLQLSYKAKSGCQMEVQLPLLQLWMEWEIGRNKVYPFFIGRVYLNYLYVHKTQLMETTALHPVCCLFLFSHLGHRQ